MASHCARPPDGSSYTLIQTGTNTSDPKVTMLQAVAGSHPLVSSLHEFGAAANTSLQYPYYGSFETTEDHDDCGDIIKENRVESKKRRLTNEQVKSLEVSFEVESKLEPERKNHLAQELGLQPRQVAIWFQNRRARYKTKRLERDYDILKGQYDAVFSEKHKLEAEIARLRDLLVDYSHAAAGFKGGGSSMRSSEEQEISQNQDSLHDQAGTIYAPKNINYHGPILQSDNAIMPKGMKLRQEAREGDGSSDSDQTNMELGNRTHYTTHQLHPKMSMCNSQLLHQIAVKMEGGLLLQHPEDICCDYCLHTEEDGQNY